MKGANQKFSEPSRAVCAIRINKLQLSIIVDRDTILAKRKDSLYTFPIIDSTKEFKIYVKLKKLAYVTLILTSQWLNKGSKIIFGRVTKINKLLSVAKYNSLEPSHESYEVDSKTFFIINHDYTIFILNPTKTKEVQFLIISPNSIGCGTYTIFQKQ